MISLSKEEVRAIIHKTVAGRYSSIDGTDLPGDEWIMNFEGGKPMLRSFELAEAIVSALYLSNEN